MLDTPFDLPGNIDLTTPILLLVLVALEAVLSADNAIALASISQGLVDEKLRPKALNIGLIFAYVLRMALIVAATWVAGARFLADARNDSYPPTSPTA